MAMALRAPQRCFLGDVSRCIVDHWQKQKQQQQQQQLEQESGSVFSDEPRMSQRPLPLPLHQQSLTLRLLGTVVNLMKTTSQSTTTTLGNRDFNAVVTTPIDYVHIVLDDGTGLVSIQAPQTMVAQIRVQVGTTLECIVRLHCKGTTCTGASISGCCTNSESRQTNVDETGYSLIADQLVVVQDAHMETLRWLELCYRKKLQSSRAKSTNQAAALETAESFTFPTDMDAPLMSMEWGFPTRSSITADDVFRIIVSDCHAYVPAPATVTPKSTGPAKQRQQGRMVQQPPMGVSIEDLADCLNLSRERVQELIQELQNNCQIYCNEHGLFVPL
jgi:hypothetical protein